jgi:DegV family protein with EDD domain
MEKSIQIAFAKGYERMAAWSDLLDDINLYPVPDADTGRNLRISLAPLKRIGRPDISTQLLMAATGNSGNIAGAFFAKLTHMESSGTLARDVVDANAAAWNALQEPQPGTMLSVFSALAEALQSNPQLPAGATPQRLLDPIQRAVLSTATQLPALRQADVVDSGALGMYLFFEGFFNSLTDRWDELSSPYAVFGNKLKLSAPARGTQEQGYCIDTVVAPVDDMEAVIGRLSSLGENVVTVRDGQRLKVHLHTADASSAQQHISEMGDLLRWKSEKIEIHAPRQTDPGRQNQRVHVVTDAAGSLTRKAAREHGVTLLDSYILLGEQHLPESTISPDQLYDAMTQGIKVTTAQASNFERCQHYDYLTQRFSNLLYLCVGSVYTGNYDIAAQWSAQNTNGGRMLVIDTGAASGRLGLIARQVAKYAAGGYDIGQVGAYARKIAAQCDELIFLDQLKYLAAGGRISKTKGFFADLFNIKPIVRPGSGGAEKVGTAKSQEGQVAFLLNHLEELLPRDDDAQILLQYTDNRNQVVDHIQPKIQGLRPNASISVQPMSLTSGVHMGPGTWAAAFLTAGPPSRMGCC